MSVNYLVMVTTTMMFAVVISWRLTTTYFPRTTTWIWTTTTSLASRMWRRILQRGGQRQPEVPGPATERFVSESEDDGPVDLKKYIYVEEFGKKLR